MKSYSLLRLEYSHIMLRETSTALLYSNSPRLLLSRKSVNAAEKSFPSRWFTYFSKVSLSPMAPVMK